MAQQCPTVDPADLIQDFCDADSPTIAELVATDGGDGVQWYDAAVGGNAIPSTISLVNNTSYWAGNISDTCTSRTEVVVNIFAPPPTNVNVGVSRCASQTNTIAQLSATGTNIEWFDSLTGGTFLPSTTPLVDGVIYYVQQSENGCTSLRRSTRVTIIDPPAPTGADQFFCIDPNNPTTPIVQDLQATGESILWYNSPTSNSPLNPLAPLINGTSYFATQTPVASNCESDSRLEVLVTIDIQQESGTSGTLDICDNSTISINLFNELGGTPDIGGTWSGPELTTNGDQGTLDTSLLDAGTFVFTYEIAAQNACPAAQSTVTITVQEEADAGTNGTLTICTNDAPVDLFTLLGGTPDTGGTWSPTLNSGTGVFDPSIDGSTTTPTIYTYTVAATAPCTVPDTATVEVTVQQAPDAGDDASVDLCISSAAIDLFTLLGGTPDTGGTWSGPSTLANGDQGTFDPAINQDGAYTYTLPASATCSGDTATVTVSIIPEPIAGENASIEVCLNDPTIDLFTLLGGTPDSGGTWSGPSTLANGDQGTFDPAADLAGNYTYTVAATSPCTVDDTADITVVVQQPPNAGTNASEDYCTSDSVINLFSLLGTADTSGTWSGPSTLTNGDQGTFDPASNTPGEYTYTLAATAVCPADESTVTINIVPQPVAGEDASIEVCLNDATIDLFTILGGSPDSGGTWTGPSTLTNGDQGTFDPAYFNKW